jgi:hypothetical protein
MLTPEGVVRLNAPLAAVVAQRTATVLRQPKLDAAVEWLRKVVTLKTFSP